MTVPTKNLTVNVFDLNGVALAGATVTATLDRTDIYLEQYVLPNTISATSDVNGVATLALFPNALGKTGSYYKIKCVHPTTGRTVIKSAIQMPNADVALSDIDPSTIYSPQDSVTAALTTIYNDKVAANQSAIDAAAAAGSASASAGSAASSAASAATSETNAAASATTASNAAASSVAIYTGIAAVNTAVTNAQTAATTATTQAGNAATSASGASTSATNAAASATSASGSATTATTQAGNASTSATNAANSATAAAGSATSASGSAATATAQAGNAATSASTATTQATNAAASATTATTQAGNAATSATAAAASVAGITTDLETLSAGVAVALDLIGVSQSAVATNTTNIATNKDANVVAQEVLAAGLQAIMDFMAVVATQVNGGAVYPGAGSVTEPSVSTQGDTNTGIYFPATDVIALVTAGLERLRVDANGRLGIGTNAPSGLLDVNDSKLRVRTAATPVSAGAAGNAGEICWDASYFYVCVATNTWKRIALSTW